MQGWIKLHRKIRLNPIFNNLQLFRLWVICLTEATHKPYDQLVGNQMVRLEQGQFVTGRFDLHGTYNRGLPKKEHVSEYTVWRWLKTLEEGDFLSINSSNKFSVVSITNWGLYQSSEQENEQQMSNKRSTNEQQMSTNKNVKNVKNDKNENNNTTTTGIEGPTPFSFYENNITVTIGSMIQQDIIQWCEAMGDSIVLEAMKRAVTSEKRNWKYITAILNNWYEKGIKTIEQVHLEQAEFERKKEQKQPRTGRNALVDKLPESVQRQLEREQQGKKETAPPTTVMDDPELKAMLDGLRDVQAGVR